MKRLKWIHGAAVLTMLATFAAHAQEVRPGLWEFKTDMNMPGQPDIAAQMAQMREQMASLPPEARAMFEQQMAGMGVGIGDGGAIRICITPEEALADQIYEGREEDGCTYTDVKRRGNTWSGTLTCIDPPGRGSFETTIHDPKHFTARNHLETTDGRIETSTESRWLSDDCGALAKP